MKFCFSTLRYGILLTILFVEPATAGMGQRSNICGNWNNNCQGAPAPSPPPPYTPPPTQQTPATSRPPIKEIEQEIADITANGQIHFKNRNYDSALEVWMVGYKLCQKHGMHLKGCYALDQRMLRAMAYRDHLKAEAEKKAKAELERRRATNKVNNIIKDTTLDFDGTGKGIDLQPMTTAVPTVPNQRKNPQRSMQQNTGHMDSSVVDLRLLDPKKSSTQKNTWKQKGVLYNEVPLPKSFLPTDPEQRRSMSSVAPLIMTALDFSQGNINASIFYIDQKLISLGGGNQTGLEAKSYLEGLYASEILYSDKHFGKQDDDEILKRAMLYPELHRDMPSKNDIKYIKNSQLITQASRELKKYLSEAHDFSGGDVEKSLILLSKRKEPGARYAYRYLQGVVAYRDLKDR